MVPLHRALGLEFVGILDSIFSSFLSEPASEGLINALWGHTQDGRGKWDTGSQTGQHFRHLSQLGSMGRAFCLPLSPASLASPAASRQENLRQQSSDVRAVPLLQCIDQSSLKESGLDIWDTYWLLHWLSSCPDLHSLGVAWITCTFVLGAVSPDLEGLHSKWQSLQGGEKTSGDPSYVLPGGGPVSLWQHQLSL